MSGSYQALQDQRIVPAEARREAQAVLRAVRTNGSRLARRLASEQGVDEVLFGDRDERLSRVSCFPHRGRHAKHVERETRRRNGGRDLEPARADAHQRRVGGSPGARPGGPTRRCSCLLCRLFASRPPTPRTLLSVATWSYLFNAAHRLSSRVSTAAADVPAWVTVTSSSARTLCSLSWLEPWSLVQLMTFVSGSSMWGAPTDGTLEPFVPSSVYT